MAIAAVTCPNCGATGVNIETAQEYSKCSYCGSMLRTKEVLHLELEGMALEKLRRNARRSFAVKQYGNARADWARAAQIDRTDYESYWGLVCCAMAMHPGRLIRRTGAAAPEGYACDALKEYDCALAYAPPACKAEYKARVEAHNARAREIQEKQWALQRFRDRMYRLRIFLLVVAVALSFLALLGGPIYGAVLGGLAIGAWAGQGIVALKMR